MKTAQRLANLLQLTMTRSPCPNPKIVKNLCSFACCDPSVTPSINLSLSVDTDEPPASPSVSSAAPSFNNSSIMNEKNHVLQCDQYNGILTLVQQHKVCAYASFRTNFNMCKEASDSCFNWQETLLPKTSPKTKQ